jgi:hypothetical protein
MGSVCWIGAAVDVCPDSRSSPRLSPQIFNHGLAGIAAVSGSKLLSLGATSVQRRWLWASGEERGWAFAGGKVRSGRLLSLGGAGHRFASQSARSVGGASGEGGGGGGGGGTSQASPSSGCDEVGEPQQSGGGPISGRAGNHGRAAPPSGSGKPSLVKILSKAKDAEHEAKLIFLQLQQLRGDDQVGCLLARGIPPPFPNSMIPRAKSPCAPTLF